MWLLEAFTILGIGASMQQLSTLKRGALQVLRMDRAGQKIRLAYHKLWRFAMQII